MMRLAVSLLVVGLTLAQEKTETGRISGTVRDSATGSPIANASVFVGVNRGNQKQTTTDAEGRFSLSDVSPGLLRLTVMGARLPGPGIPPMSSRNLQVAPGQEVAGLVISMDLPGEIAGKVVDQNKEPVAGATVILVAREYSLGALRHVYASLATADDQGEYKLAGVRPGRAYLLMAQKRTLRLDAISPAPAEVKLRKAAMVATYYPGAFGRDGAQPIVVRPGERRQGVDLRILRSPSYCVEGVGQAGMGPQELAFHIQDIQATSGNSGDGGMFILSPNGKTGADGKFRICDLPPGEYEVTVQSRDSGMPAAYGSERLTIGDRDVRNFVVAARPRVAVSGEVMWAGEAPDPPVTEQVSIALRPLTRAPYMGEMRDIKSSIPGTFSFPSVLVDSYEVQVTGLPKNAYVKELAYAGKNLRAEPLAAGSALGASTLRVVLARDGGTVAVKVADRDGNAIGDARVLVASVSVASEAALAAAIVSGQCDQNGSWSSGAMAPGKYYVASFSRAFDFSPESIGRLWASRTRFKEIEVDVRGSVQVTVSPLSLD